MNINEYCEMMGYEDVIILDNYEDAFIGISTDGRAVYDYDMMVTCLMSQDGMDAEGAVEWIEYNTLRALDYLDIAVRPIVLHSDNLQ